MEIYTEVNRKIFDSENTEIKVGDLCEFSIGTKSHCGIYKGITKKGALEFKNTLNPKVTYCVMPASIEQIKVAISNAE